MIERDTDLWISRQVLREYSTAMTRPNLLTESIPIAALVKDIQNFRESFQLAEDNEQVTQNLLTLVEAVTVGGSQIHDANIVATMQTYSISTLLTNNVKDFERFSRYISVISLESDLEQIHFG